MDQALWGRREVGWDFRSGSTLTDRPLANNTWFCILRHDPLCLDMFSIQQLDENRSPAKSLHPCSPRWVGRRFMAIFGRFTDSTSLSCVKIRHDLRSSHYVFVLTRKGVCTCVSFFSTRTFAVFVCTNQVGGVQILYKPWFSRCFFPWYQPNDKGSMERPQLLLMLVKSPNCLVLVLYFESTIYIPLCPFMFEHDWFVELWGYS